MKTKAIVVCFICLLAVLFLPGAARAQSTNCSAPTGLVPDGRIAPPGGSFFVNNGEAQYFNLNRLRLGRSYSIEFTFLTLGTENFPGVLLFQQNTFDNNTCTGTAPTGIRSTSADDPASHKEYGTILSRRFSFTASVGGDSVVVAITNATGVAFSYNAILSETTLYNPLWSTFGGFETFYKIYNTTLSGACNATLDLRTDNDVSVSSVTIPVGSGETTPTRNTGPTDLNIANDQSGHAFFTHDCPPGAIQVDGFLGFFGATTSVLPIKIVAARESAH